MIITRTIPDSRYKLVKKSPYSHRKFRLPLCANVAANSLARPTADALGERDNHATPPMERSIVEQKHWAETFAETNWQEDVM